MKAQILRPSVWVYRILSREWRCQSVKRRGSYLLRLMQLEPGELSGKRMNCFSSCTPKRFFWNVFFQTKLAIFSSALVTLAGGMRRRGRKVACSSREWTEWRVVSSSLSKLSLDAVYRYIYNNQLMAAAGSRLIQWQQNQGLKLLMTEANRPQPPALPDRPLAPFDAYHNYVQIYTTAFHLQQQLSTIASRQCSLLARLTQLQLSLDKTHEKESSEEAAHRPKRRRRLANQIDKQFLCREERCLRQYGTLGSLQQHQRLKHPLVYSAQMDLEAPNPEESSWPSKEDSP